MSLRRLDPISADFRRVQGQLLAVRIVAIHVVENASLQRRYDGAVCSARSSGAYQYEVDTFHGTTASRSIARQGFKVGGVSVPIKHGAAQGIGVYSSSNPMFAQAYGGPTGRLIVCRLCVTSAMRIGNSHIHVQPEPDLILPMYVVQYRYGIN